MAFARAAKDDCKVLRGGRRGGDRPSGVPRRGVGPAPRAADAAANRRCIAAELQPNRRRIPGESAAIR
ncbi:hypothetical protein AQ876_08060 [Burkholderia pseudomallei]|nr:hypothetical protein SZ29_18930 [Burkholderia pseudomallei]OMT59549.1 hypothetical protein AQ760_03610 [Burkholderia pseudomallei]OMZ23832.1 hypothetical protein AQ860_29365 [Burkholderia pseudomallei]OMZ32991.1 hypothetical protein AQ859_16280 [Burkholderia pseudomallei]ONA09755.1 hypothetical protein AQ876_08060 [Burkholderia pseudomallei]